MASQYSHLQFYRSTPAALLGRYFTEKHGVSQEIAFDKLKESRGGANLSSLHAFIQLKE